MNYAPLILFTYNRPTHTQQVLDALSLNKEAIESKLYIFCDGEKNNITEPEKNKIKEVRKIAEKENRFKEVIIELQPTNKGLAQSIIDGTTKIINKHGKVIVLEDDLITSPYFLQFMNDALNVHQNNDDVACISGYVYPIHYKLPDTFFIKGADCWGWATWKNKWKIFESDGKKLMNQLVAQNKTYEFDFDGSYNYIKMLSDQIEGKNNSWAIRWYASAFLKDKYCLYPKKSLVQNIGIDGSGTHSGISNKWDVNLSSHLINVLPIKVEENSLARKLFVNYFISLKPKKTSISSRIVGKIKRTFFEQGLLKIMYELIKNIYTKFSKKQKSFGWFGNYKNWHTAKNKCTGYDNKEILGKVKSAILKVKNGEAKYERDSVLFDEIQYSQPLLDTFIKIAKENNNELSIVDFGGSLGSSYFQNKPFLENITLKNWSIVEQPHFVDCGKKHIEDNILKFYYTIDEALKHHKTQVLLLSSVLAYFEHPYKLIEECKKYGFEYIIIDRTAFLESAQERITVQIVPEFIYKASYPSWFFNEQKFVNAFLDTYQIIGEFDSKFDPREQLEDSIWSYRKGFVFKKK